MLPSKGALIYCGNEVELCGSKIALLEQIHTVTGEGVKYECKRVMVNLLIGQKLWTIFDRPIEISGSADGNMLTKSSKCVTGSAKLVDFTLVCPIAGKSLHVSSNNINNTVLTQSRDRCFPLKVTIRQESKTTMINFKDMHQFLADLTMANAEGRCKVFPHMLLFKISRCADHAAHQKCLKKGGACKVKSLFYFCCTTSSNECFIPNNMNCERFCSGKDNS